MDKFDAFSNDAHNDIVPTDMNFTSEVLAWCITRLKARYPFLRVGTAGTSIMGCPIYLLKIGNGHNEVFYNASHHANEWITSLLLMRFLESYARNCAFGGKIFDINAQLLYSKTTLTMIPMVNPDGVDLVTGALSEGDYFNRAAEMARRYPDIPFPSGWKANIRGIDLNLQYPAGWENARATKYALGVTAPGPRDFVGPSPLSEPESLALYEITRTHDFTLTLSMHTQGKTIYWKYLDYEIKNAYDIAQKFALVSGYDVEETPIASGYAGYKDWFISSFYKPGFTIEAGEGISPLPLSQFQSIYSDCLGMMTLGLTGLF
ncbi:MAG: gamma-D-glutamyl-meso-diaminopimelate peptidase [Clostridiales bacterium]|nr:gamma-D-glutamyl-meso-diaminopimelate peptidase [Clostridiales bacterium]